MSDYPVYHLGRTLPADDGQPLCGELHEGEQVVPMSEARDPNGRHFNCPACDLALHGGRRHREPQ